MNQKDPLLFITTVLGSRPDDNQRKIINAIAKYNRVAVSSCHSIGKTFTSAHLALWFLFCFPKSLVLTTAPTTRQVNFLLWGEIRSAYKSSRVPLGGDLKPMSSLLEIYPREWYALGFSSQPAAKQKALSDAMEQQKVFLQGWHGDYIFIILDEAVGIDSDIWTQMEGLLTSGIIVKVLAIGNPTTKNCIFYSLFSSPSWHSISVKCYETSNMIINDFTTEEKLKREIEVLKSLKEEERLKRISSYRRPIPYALSPSWVLEKALEWGLQDPRFQGKAVGNFPEIDDMSMITRAVVLRAMQRTHVAKENGIRYIGVDVARKGTNATVFTELTESEDSPYPVQTRLKILRDFDLMSITGQLINFINFDWNEESLVVCAIDATGIGSGVYDRLRELQRSAQLSFRIKFVEVHNGASVSSIQRGTAATEKERNEQRAFLNIGALAYSDLSEALKRGLRIKEEKVYLSQLTMRRYDYKSTGKLFLESKKDYERRLQVESPDEADSLVLANFARRFSVMGEYLRKIIS